MNLFVPRPKAKRDYIVDDRPSQRKKGPGLISIPFGSCVLPLSAAEQHSRFYQLQCGFDKGHLFQIQNVLKNLL